MTKLQASIHSSSVISGVRVCARTKEDTAGGAIVTGAGVRTERGRSQRRQERFGE